MVFFVFPWEPSFLWLSIVTIFFIIVQNINIKLVYFLIFLNLFNWFYQFEIIDIKYNINGCIMIPTSAEIKPHFSKGLVLDTENRLNNISCYPDLLGEDKQIMKYKHKILLGEKFK